MQSLPSPQKVTPIEPGLASQITNALRVKVKGTVSPFKRHMSVSVLGMINNAWNRLSISQGPASPCCCAELHREPGPGEGADPPAAASLAVVLAVLALALATSWTPGVLSQHLLGLWVSRACKCHHPWPRKVLWRANFTHFSVQSFMCP